MTTQSENIRVRVVAEHGLVTNVWVENVPDWATDADVEASVRAMAHTGDHVAQSAVDAVGRCWIDMCDYTNRGATRVYLDNA